jgi:hypothetical protein
MPHKRAFHEEESRFATRNTRNGLFWTNSARRHAKLAKVILVMFLAIYWERLSDVANVTLGWDPPGDELTTGYILYDGTAPESQSAVGGHWRSSELPRGVLGKRPTPGSVCFRPFPSKATTST